jgi:hypothetical protein
LSSDREPRRPYLLPTAQPSHFLIPGLTQPKGLPSVVHFGKPGGGQKRPDFLAVRADRVPTPTTLAADTTRLLANLDDIPKGTQRPGATP